MVYIAFCSGTVKAVEQAKRRKAKSKRMKTDAMMVQKSSFRENLSFHKFTNLTFEHDVWHPRLRIFHRTVRQPTNHDWWLMTSSWENAEPRKNDFAIMNHDTWRRSPRFVAPCTTYFSSVVRGFRTSRIYYLGLFGGLDYIARSIILGCSVV